MDVMNGVECSKYIRVHAEEYPYAPYIIAQTASVTEEYRKMCKEAGMNDFLSKPVAIEALKMALEKAISSFKHLRK